jgi:hypothetical protein
VQLGAENNIEKSRCLAHLRKNIESMSAREPGFSGFSADAHRSRRNETALFPAISSM